MSIKVMEWVFEHSEAEKSDRLVLLALADNANDEHWEAYPSVQLLARKARVSKRTAQYALRSLEKENRVTAVGISRFETTIYRILTDAPGDVGGGGAESAPGASCDVNVSQIAPGGAQPVAPEPSGGTVNRQEEKGRARGKEISDPEMKQLFEPSLADAPASYPRVKRLLDAVSERRGCPKASPEAIVSAMLAFSDRLTAEQEEEVAVELGQWALHGNGKLRQIKSVGGTYRSFLRVRAEGVHTPGASVQSEADPGGWDSTVEGDV